MSGAAASSKKTMAGAGPQSGVDVSQVPCRVSEIQLKGLEKTNPEIIHRELDNVLKANNLEEIYTEVQKLIPVFTQLDIFSSMDIHITEPKKVEKGSCRLEVEFEEKRSWNARATTFVQGLETGLEGRIGWRNVRGRAEKLNFFMDYGTHHSKESALQYIQPKFQGTPIEFSARFFNSSKSHQHYSSFEERLKGLTLTFMSPRKKHGLSYQLGWQQMLNSDLRASFPVQQHLGNSIRSSLNWHFLYDPREFQFLSSGLAFRWTSQLNGLFPHQSILQTLKNKLDLQVSLKFLPWTSLVLGTSIGAVLPLKKDFLGESIPLTDRFYLGGVDSMKGFHLNRIGPTALRRPAPSDQKRDYLGGDVMYSAYASLNFFGKSRPQQPTGIHGHIFGNVGNLSSLSCLLEGPWKENLRRFGMESRASVGLGLVLPTHLGHFEVNYALPLRFSGTDSIRSGLQMSFGTDPFTV